MKYLEAQVVESEAFIVPIGDIHIGAHGFKEEGLPLLKEYIKFVKDNKNARIFLNGDILDMPSRTSKTSPFGHDVTEMEQAIDLFEPVKDRIIGAVVGNHESRMEDAFGINPMQLFCKNLNIPYCKYSAMVRLSVGKRNDNRWFQNYFLYFTHSAGGGGSVGSKLNRAFKLSDTVEGVDAICIGHNHQLAIAPQDVIYPSIQGKKVSTRRVWYVCCGSYMSWNDSYAEKMMLPPTKLGSPIIKLDGRDTEIHKIEVKI